MSSETHGAGVACDVVGAGKNDDHFRLEVEHILAEAHQHLRRGLPADAPVEVRLAGEVVAEFPAIGDGIAEEHDAVLGGRRRLESSVGVAVACELTVIVSKDGNARGPILIKAGKAGGRNGGLLLGRGHRGKQQRGCERNQATGSDVHVFLGDKNNAVAQICNGAARGLHETWRF
jgi:hypothetical protein